MKKKFLAAMAALCFVPSVALADGLFSESPQGKLQSCLDKTGRPFTIASLFQDEIPLVYEREKDCPERLMNNCPHRLYDFNMNTIVYIKNGRDERSAPLQQKFAQVPVGSPVRNKIETIRNCLHSAGYETFGND